jgi:radical SAM protein with 4Fe4S-binding SPASM domain
VFWEQNAILANHRPVHISSILPNFSKNENVLDSTSLLKRQLAIYDEALISYLKGEESILTDELKRLVGIIEHRQFFILPQKQKFFTCCHNPYSCFITSTCQLFVCEKFNSEFSVGDIFTGFDKGSLQRINAAFTVRKNTHCSKCWAKRLCRICATNLNHSLPEFEYFCNRERQKIQLALKYYCEIQIYKHKTTNREK